LRKTWTWLSSVGLMKGTPTEQPLASAYWRKKNPPPSKANPDRDCCGLLWCALRGSNGSIMRRCGRSVRQDHADYGFGRAISMTLITERAVAA
jgi:4-cresol dehydrogenase (hydroxylating)